MGHYVYKYVLNNEIIYIGKNDTDLPSRIRQHGKPGDNIPMEGWSELNKASVFFIKLANAHMSDVVECELIRRYRPKYNIVGARSWWSGLPFVEPEWIPYENIEKKQLKKKIVRKTRRSRMPEIMENIQLNAEKRLQLQWLLEQVQKKPEGEVRIQITGKPISLPGVTVTDKKGNIWGQNATGHLEYKRNTGELHYVHSDSLGCAEGLKILLCMINIQEEYAKAFVRITDEYPSIYALCKDCQKNCVIKSSWDRS